MRVVEDEIVSFGEVLWDCLPHGRFLGGAPLNVAYHLARLGWNPLLVSAVGVDALGDEVLERMRTAGLKTSGVSRSKALSTGTVRVALDDAGQAVYRIERPVAWDRIERRPEMDSGRPSVLIHGSLALRSEENRMLLDAWRMRRPRLRVFDLNLRAPFDDLDALRPYVWHADVLKLNEEEATRLMGPGHASRDPVYQARELSRGYGCGIVCITLGARGAVLYHRGNTFVAPGPHVVVRDTIGAGDAFTAALVDGLLRCPVEPDWTRLLPRACALGAFVASHDGAQPEYRADDLGLTLR